MICHLGDGCGIGSGDRDDCSSDGYGCGIGSGDRGDCSSDGYGGCSNGGYGGSVVMEVDVVVLVGRGGGRRKVQW